MATILGNGSMPHWVTNYGLKFHSFAAGMTTVACRNFWLGWSSWRWRSSHVYWPYVKMRGNTYKCIHGFHTLQNWLCLHSVVRVLRVFWFHKSSLATLLDSRFMPHVLWLVSGNRKGMDWKAKIILLLAWLMLLARLSDKVWLVHPCYPPCCLPLRGGSDR